MTVVNSGLKGLRVLVLGGSPGSLTGVLCRRYYIMLPIYCRSGNIREVSIFANFARRTNSRIQESRENYFYNSATKEKEN